jgi:hypothetical protein
MMAGSRPDRKGKEEWSMAAGFCTFRAFTFRMADFGQDLEAFGVIDIFYVQTGG